jgi:hypothetical protein
VRHLAGRGHCAGARRSWTPTCCTARTASCRPSRQYCCMARTALNQGQTRAEGRAGRCLPRDRGLCACFHLTVQCLTTEALPAGIYANQTLEHVWPAAPRLTGPSSTSFTLTRALAILHESTRALAILHDSRAPRCTLYSLSAIHAPSMPSPPPRFATRADRNALTRATIGEPAAWQQT